MDVLSCQDWKDLSEAASHEEDPEKLMDLVEQLDRVLEEREIAQKRLREGANSLNIIHHNYHNDAKSRFVSL